MSQLPPTPGSLELETSPDEPSPEDFAAAADEPPEDGQRSVVARIFRLAVVLFVVVALVFYLAVPVGVFMRRVTRDWLRQDNPIRSVPLAPEPTATPPART